MYCFTKPGLRNHHLAALLAGLLLSACATFNEQAQTEADTTAQTEHSAADGGSSPPTSDEVMYRVFAGEMAGNNGDLEQAAAEYLAAAMQSEDPAIAQRATSVALAARAYHYAAMAADRWVVLAPDDLTALETAARTMLMASDYVGAEMQLSAILSLLVDNPTEAWGRVANLLGTARHPEKTDRILQHLIEEHDAAENPYALLAQSQLAARSGDLERSAVLAGEAVNRAPHDAELQAWAGRVAMNLGDSKLALVHFEAAWKLRPEDRSLALLYAELLRQSAAPERANEVLAELPDSPEMRFTRVAFALQSESRPLAEEIYAGFDSAPYEDENERAFHAARSAEMLDFPDQALVWYEQVKGGERALAALNRRAYMLASDGLVEEARQVLKDARENGDAQIKVDTLVVESQILIEAQDSDQAFEVLNSAVRQFPDDVRLLYTRSLVAVERDRLDVAEQDLRRVIAQEPGNAAALNALGYTLADRTDRYTEAEQLIAAAYQLQPDEVSIIDSMGWIAYRLGRLEEAEAYLRQAFARDQNAEIAAHLGEVLWTRGNQGDARAVWMAGLDIDPQNRVLTDTLERFGITP